MRMLHNVAYESRGKGRVKGLNPITRYAVDPVLRSYHCLAKTAERRKIVFTVQGLFATLVNPFHGIYPNELQGASLDSKI